MTPPCPTCLSTTLRILKRGVGSVLAGVALSACAAAETAPATTGTPTGWSASNLPQTNIQVGPRPYYLVDQLADDALKQRLQACAEQPVRRTLFSIAHRGAPLQFPEHTRESYEAAARMGAGILECDVAFTQDRGLVCRHAQCDLHATTNILQTPLAAKCSVPFTPASAGQPARAQCCTSDITLAEFKTLRGKMDGVNTRATTLDDYLKGTPLWRTEAYSATGTLMTHKESIALFQRLGVGMTPELKTPEVAMPFQGSYTQAQYAQQMIDEYKAAGVPPSRVWPQSFKIEDVYYWLEREPAFGRQAVALSSVNRAADVPAAIAALPAMKAKGVRIVAPPIWALVALDEQRAIVPSDYARAARAAGLDIISWSLERSGPLTDGGGYFFQSVAPVIRGPGDYLRVLDVLAQQVGVIGVFSDWPGTVSHYASCVGKP